ncbi:unnamed protein product [Lactuca saligna]|uniref:ATP-dependent DNA helicase n=1 Tax=Lactuca saligna TaxID=75948 RepID=A0AA36EK19_LACSI|nr:unnamed protein product [Lactuca saligna]
MGDNIDDFDLPKINQNVNLEFVVFRDVEEEFSMVFEPEHLQARDFLNPEQKFMYDEVMWHIHNDIPGVSFIDGPGGTGKIFLYKALLANICSFGHTALVNASSGVAANNMPGGRITNSRFKIPLNLENNSVCKISRQSDTAQLLQAAKVIIWDTASMAKRHELEVISDKCFRSLDVEHKHRLWILTSNVASLVLYYQVVIYYKYESINRSMVLRLSITCR